MTVSRVNDMNGNDALYIYIYIYMYVCMYKPNSRSLADSYDKECNPRIIFMSAHRIPNVSTLCQQYTVLRRLLEYCSVIRVLSVFSLSINDCDGRCAWLLHRLLASDCLAHSSLSWVMSSSVPLLLHQRSASIRLVYAVFIV